MDATPNAVELTGVGPLSLPGIINPAVAAWIKAVSFPYSCPAQGCAFVDRQRDELTRMGLLSPQGVINPAVADWIKVACLPDRLLEPFA
nr:hypothetical protein [Mycobacterium tuberculosis]